VRPLAGGDHGERPGGGDAEGVHRLADEVLAQHRTDGGLAVAAAGERRAARALEVEVAAAAVGSTTSPSSSARPSPSAASSRRTGDRRRPGDRLGALGRDVADQHGDARRAAQERRVEPSSAASASFSTSSSGAAPMETRAVIDPPIDPSIDDLASGLLSACAAVGPMVVAFSGGVDSALLAVAAHRAVPDGTVLVTADSESLADGELEHCRSFADRRGIPWRPAATDELHDARYLVNDTDRCFWCKTALMDQLDPIADREAATVVLGVNVDDLGDHRPGQRAAAERGAVFPLVDAGFTKADVRASSPGARAADEWDKPAAACLASRVPYGTPVTVTVLAEVAAAESALRALGFGQLRVRHYGDLARLEVPVDELAAAVDRREEVVAAVRGGRLPLRDPRPRGVPQRQPQRRRDDERHSGT
jgi:pyridinium-3,5-biscarboxylic acid mononucleotide sulfurtransferase